MCTCTRYVDRRNAQQIVVWHGVWATPFGVVVRPPPPGWRVWTVRTAGRGSSAAVGLRLFRDKQQATFEGITIKYFLILYIMCKDMFILNLSQSPNWSMYFKTIFMHMYVSVYDMST